MKQGGDCLAGGSNKNTYRTILNKYFSSTHFRVVLKNSFLAEPLGFDYTSDAVNAQTTLPKASRHLPRRSVFYLNRCLLKLMSDVIPTKPKGQLTAFWVYSQFIPTMPTLFY